ncbi:aminoglycoside phosphotransferase [Pseudovibrio japonicus]|uniref:Aminoglycoside phosphotransferase n=2 Tax=Pseudovibrio japonicus TaxID=366534 RepID=A0ABQ3ELR2_9HYPH|nr:aminoglycoside phosphotransferase [Pseudovibrio japonicus]
MLDAQFPEWAGLPLKRVGQEGWDNNTFRLGDDLKVRLPSDERYVPQVEKEFNWLPKLANQLPIMVPAPVALGRPSADYPWPWSVYRWIDGEPASYSSIRDLNQFARDVAAYLQALWSADVTGAPLAGKHSFHRGGGLIIYDDETRFCLSGLTDEIDAAAALLIWEQALQSKWNQPARWVHGDVSAGNLLVKNGALCAAIDFGLCAVGDPACDLVIAWKFFSADDREVFKTAIDLDQATWNRAMGWSLWKAARSLYYSKKANIPHQQRAARTVIEAVFCDARHLGMLT